MIPLLLLMIGLYCRLRCFSMHFFVIFSARIFVYVTSPAAVCAPRLQASSAMLAGSKLTYSRQCMLSLRSAVQPALGDDVTTRIRQLGLHRRRRGCRQAVVVIARSLVCGQPEMVRTSSLATARRHLVVAVSAAATGQTSYQYACCVIRRRPVAPSCLAA